MCREGDTLGSRERNKIRPGQIKRGLLLPLLALLCLGASLVLAPVAAAQEQPPPDIAAKAAVMINAGDGRVIYSKNPDMQLPMASTTKMMTALLIIEDGHNMNDTVTCSKRCAEIGESSIYLKEGETLTVEQMLYGLMLPSGNDCAIALAEYDAGSVEAFVNKMNQRAAQLGLTNTHFVTPHGLDEPGHYTSARDFARLGAVLMTHQKIREIVKHSVYSIPGYGQPDGRTLINTNHLLDKYPFIDGVKTGYTDNAQECIIISAEDHGNEFILSYLGGPTLGQCDQDVINVLEYGFSKYVDRTVIATGRQYAQLDIPYSHGKLPLAAASSLVMHVYNLDNVQERLVLPDPPTLPIRKGDKVGLVEAYDGNNLLGSVYLLAGEDVPAPGFVDRIGYYLSSIVHVFGLVSVWLLNSGLKETFAP